jgi:hypothetical protein
MNHAFESALGVLGTAVPLITFAFGLVFCMLNRSFMPMIGAVVLSTAAHVVFGVVIPEREPRVSLAEAVTEAVNSLKFDRTRGLFDDLRVPASQRDYILGQMTVIAARKTPSPVEHDMADLVKRAGDGFVNLGEAGMSWKRAVQDGAGSLRRGEVGDCESLCGQSAADARRSCSRCRRRWRDCALRHKRRFMPGAAGESDATPSEAHRRLVPRCAGYAGQFRKRFGSVDLTKQGEGRYVARNYFDGPGSR